MSISSHDDVAALFNVATSKEAMFETYKEINENSIFLLPLPLDFVELISKELVL